MASETRSLTTDFIINNEITQPVFIDEIKKSSITTPLQGINVVGDTVTCFFDSALSGPEQTTLTNLANNHLGIYPSTRTEPQAATVFETDTLQGIGGTGIDINGVRITSSGTVDGRDISVDGTNLDDHIASSSGVHGIGVSSNVVGTIDSQSLTNKTLTDATNNITSNGLRSATTTVSIGGATAPTNGQILTATSGTNATWQTLDLSKTIRTNHTWAISGQIRVPSGQNNFINPFFVSLASGQTAELVSARYVINSGTSVTANVQINGVNATGFTGISITTTPSTTDPANVSLSNNDRLNLVVTGVSGTPVNLSFTAFIEYSF